MTSSTTDGPLMEKSGEDDVSLIEMANALLRNWRSVILLPLLLGFAVGLWSLTRERQFAATASFMPQMADVRGGGGGAAALAQQFGISLGSERPGQSPQFYLDLLQSRTLLRRAVESEYRIRSSDGEWWSGTLVQYWRFDTEEDPVPPWRRAAERLRRSVTASVSRETGVVQVTVSGDHPLLAEHMAETLLDLLNEYNLEVRQSRAHEEGRFVTSRLAEAQQELLAAEGVLQNFLRQNRTFRNSPELMFEHESLQRQVEMRQEIYTSLLRAREQARIDGVRDTPLLTVIDHPAGTAIPQPRRTIMRVMLALVLGLMLALGIVFVRESALNGRQTNDPHYREFKDLTRRAWSDIRQPRQWLWNGEKRVSAEKNGSEHRSSKLR
jgi:uncharacterized protein involved in exopolysaccharide biosynthesis